jgi:hypothetical protein
LSSGCCVDATEKRVEGLKVDPGAVSSSVIKLVEEGTGSYKKCVVEYPENEFGADPSEQN